MPSGLVVAYIPTLFGERCLRIVVSLAIHKATIHANNHPLFLFVDRFAFARA
jgi:hypothetical protein